MSWASAIEERKGAKRKVQSRTGAGERTFGLPVTDGCVLRRLVRFILPKDNDNDNSKLAMILICRVLRVVLYALFPYSILHTGVLYSGAGVPIENR